MKYRIVALPDGYAVAFFHATGGWMTISEHITRESAESEAQRLNLRQQAEIIAANSSHAKNREHAYTRRPVRWFEPDAFA